MASSLRAWAFPSAARGNCVGVPPLAFASGSLTAGDGATVPPGAGACFFLSRGNSKPMPSSRADVSMSCCSSKSVTRDGNGCSSLEVLPDLDGASRSGVAVPKAWPWGNSGLRWPPVAPSALCTLKTSTSCSSRFSNLSTFSARPSLPKVVREPFRDDRPLAPR